MTTRMYNPRHDPPVNRCVIGRHRVEHSHDIFFLVDGKPMCTQHVLDISGAVDSFYKGSATQAQIVRAYQNAWKEKEDRSRVSEMRRISGSREPGYVYYIRIDGLVKIGYARDVTERMRAYPPTAELLAMHPGTPAVERQIHEDFRAFLSHGREWFNPAPKLMEHVESAREKFGDPTRFAYKYRKAG